jgi:hypothetical protein
VDVIIGAAVADGKVTPKVQALIKILLKYQNTDDFRAIIFVERVVSALVLPKVIFVNYMHSSFWLLQLHDQDPIGPLCINIAGFYRASFS